MASTSSSSSSSSSGIYFYMNPEGTLLQSGQYASSEIQQEVQELNDFTITLRKVGIASEKCFKYYIVIDREVNTVGDVGFLGSMSLHPEGDMAVSSPMTKAEANVHLIAIKRNALGSNPRVEQIDQNNFRCVIDRVHPQRFHEAIAKLTKEGRLRVTPLPMEKSVCVAERTIYAKTPAEKVLSIRQELEQEGEHLLSWIILKELTNSALQDSNDPSNSSSSSNSISLSDAIRYAPEAFKEFFAENLAPKKYSQ